MRQPAAAGERAGSAPGVLRRRVRAAVPQRRRFSGGDRTGSEGRGDLLGDVEGLLRQLAVLVKAGREQAAGLDPARMRVEVAEAEAARRRAEAAIVTAEARQGEAESEAQALAEALAAAREARAVAEGAGRERDETLEARPSGLSGGSSQPISLRARMGRLRARAASRRRLHPGARLPSGRRRRSNRAGDWDWAP